MKLIKYHYLYNKPILISNIIKMSIIWLESLILQNETDLISFQSFSYLLYINMFSCICFLFYSLLYKNDKYMQKPPSKKINKK